ncbi:MAG: hypothetical protein R2707_18120 [Acidimicrobiales bacterium]
MTEHHESTSAPTAREQELELEVARLKAELETLRGDDPTAVTSRFLTMAAETVDRAVADARREADEIVEEISAEAEARRDEATRVAAEAEAMAEQLLADADRAQEAVEEATEKAAAITAEAEREAEAIVAAEREKIALEVEAVAEIRLALDEERAALDGYHESLRRRVEELANSMVSFMHTELPAGDLKVLGEGEGEGDGEGEHEHSGFDADDDPLDTPAPVAEEPVAAVTDPWLEMLEGAIPEEDRIVDVPETAVDEVPVGPLSVFGGVPVIETVSDETVSEEKRPSGGLFSRIRSRETTVVGFDDLAADDETDEETDDVGLFGSLGPRLIEQTRPDTLAEALETEDIDDQAFRQFLDGDDAPDPSRDWLLRPEQS